MKKFLIVFLSTNFGFCSLKKPEELSDKSYFSVHYVVNEEKLECVAAKCINGNYLFVARPPGHSFEFYITPEPFSANLHEAFVADKELIREHINSALDNNDGLLAYYKEKFGMGGARTEVINYMTQSNAAAGSVFTKGLNLEVIDIKRPNPNISSEKGVSGMNMAVGLVIIFVVGTIFVLIIMNNQNENHDSLFSYCCM